MGTPAMATPLVVQLALVAAVAGALASQGTPCKGDCGPTDFSPRGVPANRALRRFEGDFCVNHTSCEACVSEEACGWCNDGINHTTGCVAKELNSTCAWFDQNTCQLPAVAVPVESEDPLEEGHKPEEKPGDPLVDEYVMRRRAKHVPPSGCNPWNKVACIKKAQEGYKQYKIKPAPDHCTEYQSCGSCLSSAGCGWCGVDKDQGFCAAGRATGMDKSECTLETIAASGSYQPVPSPPSPYYAFWDTLTRGKVPPSGPRSLELKETCLGPPPKPVARTTSELPTAAEVCGKGGCRRDLGDDWAAPHVRQFMADFYDREMCPLQKDEIMRGMRETNLLNDTAVRVVGDTRLRDNTRATIGHHHQRLNGVDGVAVPKKPAISLIARGSDRVKFNISHVSSTQGKGEYYLFYKTYGDKEYTARSCGTESDSTECVIDKLKPNACYSFRGALYDGNIHGQLWSGWTDYVPMRTCKSQRLFKLTAQATLTLGGIDRAVWAAKVNNTQQLDKFMTALKVDVSNYFAMHRREFVITG